MVVSPLYIRKSVTKNLCAILTLLLAAPALAVQRTPTPPPKVPERITAVTTQPTSAPTLQPSIVPPLPPVLTPYVAFAWHTPATPLQHIAGTVWYSKDSDSPAVAAQLKAIPAGERALLRANSRELLIGNSADQLPIPGITTTRPSVTAAGPWLEYGADAEAAFERQFLMHLQQHGASVDYLVLDLEWGINSECSREQLSAIQADPRWASISAQFNVPASVPLGDSHLNDAGALAFDMASAATLASRVHRAFCDPLHAVFPAARCSDFGDGVLPMSLATQAPDLNGVFHPAVLPMHGDTQSPVYYSQVGNIGQPWQPWNTPVSPDWSQPMPILCAQVGAVRAYAAAGLPIIPWINGKGCSGSPPTLPAMLNSAYWDELVFHLCLSGGTTNLLLWNPNDGATQYPDAAALDADLQSLQAATGNSPTLRPLTAAAVPYGSGTLVSAARCNDGRVVARVTIAATQPNDTSVSVGVAGLPVSAVVKAGNVGAWVVSAGLPEVVK
jgi:hypothetical protein